MDVRKFVFSLAWAVLAAAHPGHAEPIPATTTTETADYDAREWGVILGPRFSALAPQIRLVREPVIYFTSRDKKDFSLRATFQQGTPTAQFPGGVIDGASVIWNRVSFSSLSPAAVPDTTTCKVLQGYFPTLNAVQADPITVDGISCRFLFYEGAVMNRDPIETQLSADCKSVLVKNISAYPVSDIIVTVENLPAKGKLTCSQAELPLLEPGRFKKILFNTLPNRGNFPDLNKLGFKADEDKAFQEIWRPFRFGQGHSRSFHFRPTASVIYRLSPEACDAIAHLDFNPKPKNLTRAIFVLRELM